MKNGAFEVGLKESELCVRVAGFERHWRFGPKGAVTCHMAVAGHTFSMAENGRELPDCVYDGLLSIPRRAGDQHPDLTLVDATVEERDADAFESVHHHVTAEWHEPCQNLRLVRKWSVYPSVAAAVSHAEIQSESRPQALDEWKVSFDNVVDRVPVCLAKWRVTAVRFYGRTDYHNEYVVEEERVVSANDEPVGLQGNLLFLVAPDGRYGLFILHEAPPENEKRPECDATFRVGPHGVEVLGWGIRPEEVAHDRLRRSYSVAVGGWSGGEHERLVALRRYLKTRFPARSTERAVVANPWGDGHCHERFSEQFLLAEIEAAGEVGATHYQIDDGWQAGGVLSDLTRNNMARPPDYWEIHPEKLPNGFAPLVEQGRKSGVELALWFAPDVARGYRNWEEDRDILLRMHRRYGINLIKLDGVRLYTKSDEEGLMNLLTGVITESGGQVRFNLDVTNGMRLGYFVNQRFGTIFVENRYVIGKPSSDRTYYPWRVLRNLWRLARYVPPEKLQFEFANLHEAAQNEAMEWDRQASTTPFNCSWEYAAAVTLMAAPLCWLQPSRLPPETRPAIRRIVELQREIAPELAANFTFPVGDEPDGHRWTGFLSHPPDRPEEGIVVVYREDSPEQEQTLPLPGLGAARGGELHLACLSHREPPFERELDGNGGVRFGVPQRMDYRLYRYRLEN